MKNLLFITVACLCLLAVSAEAQVRVGLGAPPEMTAEEAEQQMQVQQYFAERVQDAMMKGAFSSAWNGRGVASVLMALVLEQNDPLAVLVAFGISEEQNDQINASMMAAMMATVEGMSGDSEPFRIVAEMEQLQATSEIPDAETIERILYLMEKTTETQGSLFHNAATSAMEEVLSPEHLQQIQETLLANMAEIPFVTPSMFEVLNLTDVQKEQMEQIKKELEPEFEAALENWMTGYKTLQKMTAEDPEHKKIVTEIQSKGQAFAIRFRTRMFDVLSDEQWVRLQNLIDNPPEHALIFRKALKELSGEDDESKGEESGEWVPGPNSWRPGDAIPMQYRLERNTRGRFPRGEE